MPQKHYIVETRATTTRIYYVAADNEKAAEAKACNMAPAHEEDTNEETISITPDAAAAPAPRRRQLRPPLGPLPAPTE